MNQTLHKIRARTLEEAYRQMRRRLGADAVVVRTATVTEGGLWGFFGRRLVELTASAPAPPPRVLSAVERKYAAAQSPPMTGSDSIHYFEKLVREAQQRMQGAAPEGARPAAAVAASETGAPGPGVVAFPRPQERPETQVADLRREVRDIRDMIQVLYAEQPGAALPPAFAPHYRALVERGVARKTAAGLIVAAALDTDEELLRDPRIFAERLNLELRKRINATGGISLTGGECRVVALCGATGVGKTTNLAKLAARFAVHERARVGLVSADTYRIAAAEQLRVYANIIGAPFRVVNDARELRAALEALRNCDIVFIDTAGGSQFNLEQINETKGMLQAASPHEILLVLSANTQLEDLRNIVSNFSCAGPTGLLFTKLDETRRHGPMVSVLLETTLPVTYLSTGQNVPDDLALARPEAIANLLLEGRNGSD